MVKDFSLTELIVLSSILTLAVLFIAYAIAGYYERRGHRRQLMEKVRRLQQAKSAPKPPSPRAGTAVSGGSKT